MVNVRLVVDPAQPSRPVRVQLEIPAERPEAPTGAPGDSVEIGRAADPPQAPRPDRAGAPPAPPPVPSPPPESASPPPEPNAPVCLFVEDPALPGSAPLPTATPTDADDGAPCGEPDQGAGLSVEGALLLGERAAMRLDYGAKITNTTDKVLGAADSIAGHLVDAGVGLVAVYGAYRGATLIHEGLKEEKALPRTRKIGAGVEKLFMSGAAGLKTVVNVLKSTGMAVVNNPAALAGLQIATEVLLVGSGAARLVVGGVKIAEGIQGYREEKKAREAAASSPEGAQATPLARTKWKKKLVEGAVDVAMGGALVVAAVVTHGAAPVAIVASVLAVDTAMFVYNHRKGIKAAARKVASKLHLVKPDKPSPAPAPSAASRTAPRASA